MENYEKIGWIDSPATDTPINADNLNHMDEGIYNADAKAEDASIIGYSNSEVITDAINGKALGLKAYGKCYYGTATPSPENPQDIETWNGTVTTSNGSESSLAELGIELYGMRVTAGGNYTDSEGQDWWSDKANFLSGEIERNVGLLELDSTWDWVKHQTIEGVYYLPDFRQTYNAATAGHCNKLSISFSVEYAENNSLILSNDLYIKVESIATLSDFKAWLDAEKIVLLYNLINPTKEIIPEESRAALAMLDVYEESTNVNYGLYPPFAWLGYTKNTSSGLLFADLNSAKVVANPQIDDDAEKLKSLQIGDAKYKLAGGGGGASTASDVEMTPTPLIPKTNVQSAINFISGVDYSDIATIKTESVSMSGASLRIIYPKDNINDVVTYTNVQNKWKDYPFFAVGYFFSEGGWKIKALEKVRYDSATYEEGEIIKTFAYNVISEMNIARDSKPLFVLSEEGKSLVSEEEKSYWSGKADKSEVELVSTSATSPITDSANGCIRYFEAFGKCEQGENPSPDNPQEIKAWNGKITTHGKNLSDVAYNMTWKSDLSGLQKGERFSFTTPIDTSINKNFIISFRNKAYNQSYYPPAVWYRYRDAEGNIKTKNAISTKSEYATCSIEVDEDAIMCYFFVVLDGIADNSLTISEPMIRYADTDATYVPYKAESTADLGISLYGIKVSSGGNYTDADGQQWLCDKLDMQNGVVERYTSFNHVKVDSPSGTNSRGLYYYNNYTSPAIDKSESGRIVSNKYIYNANAWNSSTPCMQYASGNNYVRFYDTSADGVELDLVYVLESPTTEPLTSEQITALRQLQTYSDSTYVEYGVLEPFSEVGYWKGNNNGQSVADVDAKIDTKVDNSAFESYIADFISIANHTYKGKDLTIAFADEIKNFSDEWAWIKDRKTRGDFSGLNVCDYIPVTFSNGYVINMQIMGINTYRGYGDQEIGNHIDFIGEKLWQDIHVMNKVNFNNGNANSPNPFLASDLNYWLNSKSGNVPNSTSDASVTTEVDYTSGGVLYYMPNKVKNQIIAKRLLMPSRYTVGSVLTNDNSWSWQSTEKLWIPSEVEVYGATCWGNNGYGSGGFVQYTYFANNMNKVKKRCSSNDRYTWWLLSAYSVNSTNFALIGGNGNAYYASATYTNVALPICFRI